MEGEGVIDRLGRYSLRGVLGLDASESVCDIRHVWQLYSVGG